MTTHTARTAPDTAPGILFRRLSAICMGVALGLTACGGGGGGSGAANFAPAPASGSAQSTGATLPAGSTTGTTGSGGTTGSQTATGTMGRATTPTLDADQSGCAVINYYDIGPDQKYKAISEVPWSLLKGCDTVRIYPKANNDAYNEMLLLSAGSSATPTAPTQFMRVIGMPDPATGALPIIDGTNATQLETLPDQAAQSLQYNDKNSTPRALYLLGAIMVSPQYGYVYDGGPAGYIGIENLEIRNVVGGAPFEDGTTGAQGSYINFSACLYVEKASHLVIKNNILHNCGNGLFINSKHGALVELSQDVLVEGNRFFNNGNAPVGGVGGFSEHHSYTEARGVIFQYNHFGGMRPGANGDCLKDRSSGLIVRYNTFASNCGLALHLVDPTGGMGMISGEPDFGQTYVYGNLFDFTVAAGDINTNLLRYGGDSGIHAQYRKGTLFFYNNTLIAKGDAVYTQYPEVFLFNMMQPSAVADVRNNVFYTAPVSAGQTGKIQTFALGGGTVNMTSNWVSPNATQFWAGQPNAATVNGWSTNLGANAQPMFVDENAHNFAPMAGSPLVDAGASLNTLALPSSQPGRTARKQNGAIDIGAFEF